MTSGDKTTGFAAGEQQASSERGRNNTNTGNKTRPSFHRSSNSRRYEWIRAVTRGASRDFDNRINRREIRGKCDGGFVCEGIRRCECADDAFTSGGVSWQIRRRNRMSQNRWVNALRHGEIHLWTIVYDRATRQELKASVIPASSTLFQVSERYSTSSRMVENPNYHLYTAIQARDTTEAPIGVWTGSRFSLRTPTGESAFANEQEITVADKATSRQIGRQSCGEGLERLSSMQDAKARQRLDKSVKKKFNKIYV